MKKTVTVLAAGILSCMVASAQSLKVVNTFGGDADSTGGSDLFVFENQKDEDGSYKNEFGNSTRASNRLQMDASGEKLDARVRMEIGTTMLNGKESMVRLRGYGRFKPVEQFQIIAGNDFFTKSSCDAGYLAASDDYPKYARILQNGLGIASSWKFGDEEKIRMNFAAGLKGNDDSFIDKDKLGLDVGFNVGVKDLLTVSAAFQNVTGNKMSIGCFAGLGSVENLTLNAGYVYNNTDTDFIASSSKNSVSLSAGYDFKDIGLAVGADLFCGLGNEYLENGETKKYEKDGDGLTPFMAKANVSYKTESDVTVGAKLKVSAMLGDEDSVKAEIYPNVSYKLPKKMGTLSSGLRMNLDKDGLAKFAVPLSWKCTLAEIKN